MVNNASYYAARLQLTPHPEGGYFKETYRAESVLTTAAGERNVSTAIYFLLENDNFSAFHRIKSDEAWHFYDGDPLTVYIIQADGRLQEIHLGLDLVAGQVPQAVVPANCWFASRVSPGGQFSLVGCTVAPGFDFADFEMAKRKALINEFPSLSDVITSLTRN